MLYGTNLGLEHSHVSRGWKGDKQSCELILQVLLHCNESCVKSGKTRSKAAAYEVTKKASGSEFVPVRHAFGVFRDCGQRNFVFKELLVAGF